MIAGADGTHFSFVGPRRWDQTCHGIVIQTFDAANVCGGMDGTLAWIVPRMSLTSLAASRSNEASSTQAVEIWVDLLLVTETSSEERRLHLNIFSKKGMTID